MCFSAPVSFITSAMLGTIAIASFTKIFKAPANANKIHIGLLLFACYPLFFSIQQFIEGLTWVNLTQWKIISLNYMFSGIYIFFVLVVWPILLPLSVYAVEDHPARKKILLLTLLPGFLVAINYLNILLYPVQVDEFIPHLHYKFSGWTTNRYFISILYIISTCISYFISSKKLINMIGVFLSISFILSLIIYYQFFISVWCFFGTAISLIAYVFISKNTTTSIIDH